MKTWYIRRNNKNLGPYSVEELRQLSLTHEDYVWKEGLANWRRAASLPELEPLLTTTIPPPFLSQKNTAANSTLLGMFQKRSRSYTASNRAKSRIRTRLIGIGILLVLSLLTYIIYANNQTRYLSPFSTVKPAEEIKTEVLQTEKQNPVSYISERTSNRQNLLGQTVLEGTLTNAATVANFKDVMLKVDFFSKTNTIIATENVSIYEQINPGQTISYKKKIYVSKDVANVHITVIGATPVN